METISANQKLLNRLEISFAQFYYKYSDDMEIEQQMNEPADIEPNLELYRHVLKTMLNVNRIFIDTIRCTKKIKKKDLECRIFGRIINLRNTYYESEMNAETTRLIFKVINDTYSHLNNTFEAYFFENSTK